MNCPRCKTAMLPVPVSRAETCPQCFMIVLPGRAALAPGNTTIPAGCVEFKGRTYLPGEELDLFNDMAAHLEGMDALVERVA